MDLHETHHKEVQRMPAVLLGVASAAIGFAFHETADRQLSLSLLPILGAVIAWAGSFTAGVLYSRAYANGIRGNIALNIADEAQNAEWRAQSKAMFDNWNGKASRRYHVQQWLLLTGALLYLAGHVWHIAEAPIGTSVVAARGSQHGVVAHSDVLPQRDAFELPREGKPSDLLRYYPRPVATVAPLDRKREGP